MISEAYAIIYFVPRGPLPIDLRLAGLAAGLGVGVTLVATWAAAFATLRERPATLMLPRAPKAGKRILLERIAPLWRRLSFSWKVTFRNLFRYKKRFVMTVIGLSLRHISSSWSPWSSPTRSSTSPSSRRRRPSRTRWASRCRSWPRTVSYTHLHAQHENTRSQARSSLTMA